MTNVRPLIVLLPLTSALAPSLALAGPPMASATEQAHLWQKLVENERAPAAARTVALASEHFRGTLLRPPALADAPSALDCQHATHDITLHPTTGATSATLELRIRAVGKPLAAIGFSLDEGLAVDSVSATERSTSVSQAIFSPVRALSVGLSPALLPGEETTISLHYEGTLACAATDGGNPICSKSNDFSYFARESVFPYIYDPELPASLAFDGLTRDITLRVPAGLDVVATGQRVSETLEGTTKVSRWSIDKPLSRVVAMYALAGTLGK
ncbi:MAG TPA: hypothetical protein VM580_24205, partial [Labilithrix sp.]|nr:hypothetical protein [Labilithrix sp.]